MFFIIFIIKAKILEYNVSIIIHFLLKTYNSNYLMSVHLINILKVFFFVIFKVMIFSQLPNLANFILEGLQMDFVVLLV